MLNVVFSWGQILTFDFAGLAGSEASANSNFNNGSIASSTITRGAGLTASGNADRFNATNWALTNIANAISGNKYMEFTITPNSGCDFSVSSIVIQVQRSNTGPSQIALRSSEDAFASNLGGVQTITDNTTTQTFTFTFSQSNINVATTYRFYMFAEAVGGSGGIGDGAGNDIIVNGTTACGPPSTTITTTTLSSSSFTVNCSTAATGTVDFTSTGTFTAGNVYTAQLSNAAGSFAAPISIGTLNSTSNSGTINISIPGGTATGAGYRIRVISSAPATTGTDNGSNISITLNPCTITTGVVSGGPFAVDCSTSDAGSVAFTSSGTFAVGNTFTVQLSSAGGSFASPTTIGTLTGASAEGLNPSGSINFTIPSATASGAGYLIRIISSNPSVTGSSSTANTVTLSGGPCTLTPIHITSMLFDGCDVSCGSGAEGKSEIIFGTTGGYSLTPNATNVVLTYTNGVPYVMTSAILNNTATTSALNTAAGCPGLFVDGFGSTIPPNSSFLLVSNNLCVSALTWSNLCGTGPIYVIYGSTGSAPTDTWHDNGNFGNSGGVKNFSLSFTATDGTVISDTYSYTAPGSATDGNYAKWNEFGGSPIEQGNMPNCDITPVVLPSELVSFYGLNNHEINSLYWQTASEQNNDYFTLSHSIDGYNFTQLAQLDGAGNSGQTLSYSFDHTRPASGINYYKLSSTDFDGSTYLKGIIAVNTKSNLSFYNAITSSIELSSKSSVALYSLEGRLILTSEKTTHIPFNESGVYLLVNQLTGETERIFIPE